LGFGYGDDKDMGPVVIYEEDGERGANEGNCFKEFYLNIAWVLRDMMG